MAAGILVVDDEPEIADLVTVYLRGEGFRVYPCGTGTEALEILRREEIDLAVLDVMLPDISGMTLCAEIRRTHQFPILMLTAKSEDTDKITGLTVGADDYMTKPLSPLEMVAVYSPQKAPEIVIGSELVFYEEDSSTAEYETVYQYNDKKPEGYEQVVQEGRDGVRREVYEIIYQDGVEIARQLVEQVESETVDEIIEKGTGVFAAPNESAASIASNGDGTGTITLENGSTVTYSSVRTMRGTAYTKNESGVGSRTASGTAVRRGVVAVDRKVLPLGTKVYVVSNDGYCDYGMAVAEDTGVRGNTIDLYMDSYNECIQFGVRECTVYILD